MENSSNSPHRPESPSPSDPLEFPDEIDWEDGDFDEEIVLDLSVFADDPNSTLSLEEAVATGAHADKLFRPPVPGETPEEKAANDAAYTSAIMQALKKQYDDEEEVDFLEEPQCDPTPVTTRNSTKKKAVEFDEDDHLCLGSVSRPVFRYETLEFPTEAALNNFLAWRQELLKLKENWSRPIYAHPIFLPQTPQARNFKAKYLAKTLLLSDVLQHPDFIHGRPGYQQITPKWIKEEQAEAARKMRKEAELELEDALAERWQGNKRKAVAKGMTFSRSRGWERNNGEKTGGRAWRKRNEMMKNLREKQHKYGHWAALNGQSFTGGDARMMTKEYARERRDRNLAHMKSTEMIFDPHFAGLGGLRTGDVTGEAPTRVKVCDFFAKYQALGGNKNCPTGIHVDGNLKTRKINGKQVVPGELALKMARALPCNAKEANEWVLSSSGRLVRRGTIPCKAPAAAPVPRVRLTAEVPTETPRSAAPRRTIRARSHAPRRIICVSDPRLRRNSTRAPPRNRRDEPPRPPCRSDNFRNWRKR